MKNSVLTFAVIVILVALFSNAYSQASNMESEKKESDKKHNIWVGLRGGMDLETPTIDTEEIKTQLNSNYQFGAFMRLGKKLFIQPEVYYAVRNEQFSFALAPTEEKVMVNSLKVPVLLGIRIINLGIVSAHVMAGPVGTMFLSQSHTEHEIERSKNEYKVQLGGGVDILGFITIDVRYSVNLNDNIKEELNQLRFKDGVNVTLGLKFR
ncbi:MAG: outer membrane beta-barrel protein [Bacteroidota bacterium]|nr:outer membrane beta-barrel protein [Bacteroidota bacterium]